MIVFKPGQRRITVLPIGSMLFALGFLAMTVYGGLTLFEEKPLQAAGILALGVGFLVMILREFVVVVADSAGNVSTSRLLGRTKTALKPLVKADFDRAKYWHVALHAEGDAIPLMESRFSTTKRNMKLATRVAQTLALELHPETKAWLSADAIME